ncbi:MAG TPA: RND transporter, partial [Pseudomonas sp.]|nr:RND transporter [Pseudomonas sp.]
MKVFAPLLLALAVSACAVGPHYQAPAPAPAQLKASQQPNVYDQGRFEALWWRQFEDPTLNALVASSLDGNRQLRAAFARLRAARALRDDDANDLYPTVTSRASSQLGKAQQPGLTEQRVNSERYDLGLDMA